MTLFSSTPRLLLLVLFALGLSGCYQMSGAPEDEKRDPNYLSGKSRVSSMDFDGAIVDFENALQANPKSAAAHLELGLLYEEKKNDYATAIYHFQRHLDLQRESNMAEMVKQHIISCKVELAKTVPFALVNRLVNDEIRHLNSTNLALTELVAQLRGEMAQQAAGFSNRLAAAVAQVSLQTQPQAQVALEPERRANSIEKQSSPVGIGTTPRPAVTPRSHVVKPGETLANIARKYNLKLTSLQAANPGVEPRKLKAGQTLNLPGKN